MAEIVDRLPEILPRESDSIIRQYVEEHEEEIEEFENDLEAIALSKQVNNASGDDLDEVGALFGEVGERLGRDDGPYRKYLKSVVQAFSGRGTDLAMRRAFATSLDIDVDDVQLTEDTTNVEYDVVLSNWSDHRVSTIYEIGEIVDPSGVSMGDLRYTNFDEEVGSADATATDANLTTVADESATADAATVTTDAAGSGTWGDNWDFFEWA